MLSTPSLPLFLGPLWPVVEVPNWVIMEQIEQTVCRQMTDVKLWLLYSNTWKHLAQARLSMLSTKYVYKSYIYLIYIYIKRIWHYITYNGWYAIKHNQTKLNK